MSPPVETETREADSGQLQDRVSVSRDVHIIVEPRSPSTFKLSSVLSGGFHGL